MHCFGRTRTAWHVSVSRAAETIGARAPSSPLRATDFRRLLVGDTLARLGYQVTQFMLPLVAATTLHAGGFRVGLVSVSQTVPVIGLSLAAGLVADRVSARVLVTHCNVARAAALGLLGLLYAVSAPSFWPLIVAAVLVGSATVFYDVGYQATVPKVLEAQRLTRGNGFLQASFNATLMTGPALAGLLIQAAGVSGTIALVTALFLAAVLSFRSLQAGAAVKGARAAVSLMDGLKYTWRCRPIRDLCVQSGLFNLHEQAFLTAFLLYGVGTAGLSGGTVGLVIGAGGLGAVAGSLATGHLSKRLHAGWTVTLGLIASGAALLCAALLAEPLKVDAAIVFAVGFFINGVAQAAYNVLVVSLRQALPPREFLGAVTAAYRLVSFGPIPLGALVGGVLVQVAGATNALPIIATSLIISSLHLLPSPVKRLRTVEDAESSAWSSPRQERT